MSQESIFAVETFVTAANITCMKFSSILQTLRFEHAARILFPWRYRPNYRSKAPNNRRVSIFDLFKRRANI